MMKRDAPRLRRMLAGGALRAILWVLVAVCLYPVFWNLISSFKTSAEYLSNPYALPSALRFDNYAAALEKANMSAYFGNSIFVVALSTVLLLLFAVPCAYALARWRFPASRAVLVVYMACIFLQPTYIMIPLFLELQWLGSLNSLPMISLVYAVMQFPFAIFTLHGFLSALPSEFEEAARIDGASNPYILTRVVVPLAKPGIVTITMLAAMGFWNEYPLALVLLTDENVRTLPIGLANLYEVQRFATNWGALFAGLTMVLVPTVVLYLVGQRYLLQGIAAGGIKE
jgi:N-acetylglucosamine transport system permease protein